MLLIRSATNHVLGRLPILMQITKICNQLFSFSKNYKKSLFFVVFYFLGPCFTLQIIYAFLHVKNVKFVKNYDATLFVFLLVKLI